MFGVFNACMHADQLVDFQWQMCYRTQRVRLAVFTVCMYLAWSATLAVISVIGVSSTKATQQCYAYISLLK
eukprot:18143-Heterococcus_DN1.PRE.5